MKTLAAAALALALTTGAAVAQPAQDAENQRDLTCMAVFLTIADSEDVQMQQAGTIGSLFFYGRLQGRAPEVNWFERLAAYAEAVTMDELMGHAQECGGIVERVGQEMVDYSEQYTPAEE